jgi:hypothetical protein
MKMRKLSHTLTSFYFREHASRGAKCCAFWVHDEEIMSSQREEASISLASVTANQLI